MAWNIGSTQNDGWDIGAAQGAAAPTTYTVTYDGNGEDSGTAPVDGNSPYSEADTVTVLGNTGSLFRSGYCFSGWNTESGGGGTSYSAGETFSMPASNITLYAVWSVCTKILLTGPGITPLYFFVNSFKPTTKLSLKWIQLSDNNYAAVDRGVDSDVYTSKVKIIGLEADINQFITELEANRVNGSNVVTMSGFSGVDDQIYGLNFNYSQDITATVISYDKRPQRTLSSWSFEFTIQAISYTLLSSPSLPTTTPEIGYKSYTDRTISKIDTFDGTFSYSDENCDSGVFDGTFELCTSDAKSFKQYLCSTIRGGEMTITISGVDFPLGPNRGTGAIDVKVIEFVEEQININRWRFILKLTEVI